MDKSRRIVQLSQGGLHGGVKVYEFMVSGYILVIDSLPGEIML